MELKIEEALSYIYTDSEIYGEDYIGGSSNSFNEFIDIAYDSIFEIISDGYCNLS